MTTPGRTITAEVIVNHEGREMLVFAFRSNDPWAYRVAAATERDLEGSKYAYGPENMGAATPREAWRYHRQFVQMYACAHRAAGERCAHFDR